jgi:HlyD family secretion protein
MRGGLRPVPVPIKVGLSDGTFTEVVSGDLNDGDGVVVEAVTEDGAAAPTARPTSGANMPRMRL